MPYKILFIEDAKEMQEAVGHTLKRECVLTVANSIKEARTHLESGQFDLVLLDLSLPDGEGFKICTHIRQMESLRDIPIIFLTGRAEIEDKEMAFSIGADDYIVKPCDGRELRARVLSRLARAARKETENTYIGDLRLVAPLQQAVVVKGADESPLELTPLEFKLLYYFAQHEEQVFSRDQLIGAVWGHNIHILDRTVDAHISHLRKKLESADSRCSISPVHGVGYKFVCGGEK